MEKNGREKKRYLRELLIMAFVLALIGLTVSYATVNATLDIAGISAVRVAQWSVDFDMAEVLSKTGTAEILKEPDIKGSNIHYEVKLNNVGDSVKIKAVVKNNGTIDAELESYDIFGIPSEYEDYVSFKVTGEDNKPLEEGLTLKGSGNKNSSGRYTTVYLTITYEKTIYDNATGYKSFDLGLSLHFVQDGGKCDRHHHCRD